VTKAKVAIVKSHPSSVLEDINRLLDLSEVENALDDTCSTILKDNISWHMPFLSANTTPWQLEGTILGLKKRGITDLSVVHNNTVVTDPVKGGKLNRLTPIYKKHSIKELYNYKQTDMKWEVYHPKTSLRILHRIYPEGIKLPDYFFGKNIVHLPTVKCHIYTTTTGAMKNAFGGLLHTKRHYTHSHIHETLVDLLAIQQDIHAGIFTVMDGTICGNGPGPRTMFPVQKNLMLASSDSVAIDAVAAKLMGFNPMNIDYIRLADECELGVGRPEEIHVIGEDVSRLNFGFHVGDNMASRVGDILWFSPMRKIQKIFFRTPLIYFFIFSSFLYHDYIWWPLIGKERMRAVLKTDWGKLFLNYPLS